jgi:hypothetical protein
MSKNNRNAPGLAHELVGRCLEWNSDLSNRPPPDPNTSAIYGDDAEYFGYSVCCVVELSNGVQCLANLWYENSEWIDAESMGGYNIPVTRWRLADQALISTLAGAPNANITAPCAQEVSNEQ